MGLDTRVTSPDFPNVAAPDLIFTGGKVLVDGLPQAATVAVTGDRITAVGGDEIREQRGPRTELVDIGAGLLHPGFIDAHIHPVQGGLERMQCDLSQVNTAPEYLAIIAAYAHANPDVPWITGGGWAMPAFPGGTPRADALDSVVSDRPVFLPNKDHHGAWVNSRALQLAGIDRHTPDPADGRIERDADGTPSGTLHEGAMSLVFGLVPADTADQRLAGLLLAQQHLHSLGITGWQDAIIGSYANIADNSDSYLEAADSGQLTARVVGALWWDRTRGAEQIPELIERRTRLQRKNFRTTSVKIMQDGIAENFTAAMSEPYFDGCGCRTGNSGLSFVDPIALREYTVALDAAGFQIHVHAIGDRAIREALDAFELARRTNGGNDQRHHIAHLQVIHPDDVPRFAKLDVSVNMQALWAAYEQGMVELTVPFLGDERVRWQYPFGALERAGAHLAAGSDWPISTADPWAAIHVAVNRRLAGVGPETEQLLPEQALSLRSAVLAYTSGSARLNHLDDGGIIAGGHLADLVLSDRDPYAGAAAQIADTTVVATWVGGQRVTD
jgi:predicted amidohydrolase YtcJ